MAEKILNTRILNKIDTLEAWNSSSLKIKKGEICLATVAASAGTGLTEPVVMAKIGTAEEKTFAELPWSFYAKASDVLAACKSEDALKTFINGVIADAGIATSEAMNALAGRVTTAEGEIDTLQSEMDAVEAKAAANETAIATLNGLVGDTKVATQISNAIAALNLAETYAAKTHGHEIADVNGLADSIAAAKKAGTDANAALEAYKTTNDAAVKVNSDAIAGIKNGETLDNFKEVEEALAGKQAAGNYSVVGHKHEIADVNGLSDAIAAAQKAGTDAAATAESNAKAYAKEYADGLAGNYDAAGSAAQALTDAKGYVDGFTGGKTVSESINAVIANYSTTEQMNSAIAGAKGEAISHANGLNTAMDARVQVVEGKAHEHTFVESELNLIKAGDVEKWNAAEQNAKDHADGLDEAMDVRMKAVEAKLGAGEGGVDAQIEAAVAAEAALREAADNGLDGRIAAIEDDYLKAADKTALQDQIDVLDGLVGDETVAKQITDVTDPLAARVKAVEDDYLKAADKTELEGKITANANAIELLTNGVSAEEVDGVNDLIQYVKEHGTEVTAIQDGIKANTDRLDALHTVATTGSWNDLEDKPVETAKKYDSDSFPVITVTKNGQVTRDYGIMPNPGQFEVIFDGQAYDCDAILVDEQIPMGPTTINGRRIYLGNLSLCDAGEDNGLPFCITDRAPDSYMTIYVKDPSVEHTIQATRFTMGECFLEDYIPDTIARVADQNAIANRVTANETAIESLDGRVTAIETEHNTETTGLKARLTQAEADIDALETKVGDKTVAEQISSVTNPLAERVVALEAIDHDHANKAELDKFADGDKAKLDAAVQTVTAGTGLKAVKTGTDVAIDLDETVTFIFDCGTSAV